MPILCKNKKVVQAFIADGADKTLRLGVHVGGIGDCGSALDAVLGIGEMLQFARIVMDKISIWKLFGETGQLVPQESNVRVIGITVLDDSPCSKLDDKEDVEAFEAEQVSGEEVAGEEGIPVGREE
jgi:hypothetical protein